MGLCGYTGSSISIAQNWKIVSKFLGIVRKLDLIFHLEHTYSDSWLETSTLEELVVCLGMNTIIQWRCR